MYHAEIYGGDNTLFQLQHDLSDLSQHCNDNRQHLYIAEADVESELACLASMYDAYVNGVVGAYDDLNRHGRDLLEHVRLKLLTAQRLLTLESANDNQSETQRQLQLATQATARMSEKLDLVFKQA